MQMKNSNISHERKPRHQYSQIQEPNEKENSIH